MTPKEKAKQLLWKYLPLINGWEGNEKTSLAKKLALVCVEELLYFADTQANGLQKGISARVNWIEYFNKVKKELSLL